MAWNDAAAVPSSGKRHAIQTQSIALARGLSAAAHMRLNFHSGCRAESRSNLCRLLLQTKTDVLADKTLLPRHHLGQVLPPHMRAQKSHFEIFFAILAN
jgi:hypothetical protein